MFLSKLLSKIDKFSKRIEYDLFLSSEINLHLPFELGRRFGFHRKFFDVYFLSNTFKKYIKSFDKKISYFEQNLNE